MLRILADENIPSAVQALSPLGEVALFKGRELRKEHLAACDALVVRSVTRVDRKLLEGTPVRFVATATAGTEHVHEDDLAALGVQFASAPGSNATSVVEWVLSALSPWLRDQNRSFEGLTVAIIGCGNVGGRLCKALEALGAKVLPVDPPLAEKTGDRRYVTLKEVVDADVLTFHVPHVEGGPHPTVGMVSQSFLSTLRSKPLFINASRGEVVDEGALLGALDGGYVRDLMLDVWQGEPRIRPELLNRCLLSTPHIAGYAFTAKLKGLQMVVDALCRWLGKPGYWDWRSSLGPEANPVRAMPAHPSESFEEYLNRVIQSAYDVRRDSRALREGPVGALAAHFDRLRKEYPRRSEWECHTIQAGPIPAPWRKNLESIGFKVI
ncbi:MAG: 4-phosphoerythronate dehydrogenase [Spirochaetes bacterium]|nr:4-phosphoerythronate dehydrogenase [Spirochaetota bacterium]